MPLSVLLVDDNPHFLRILDRFLTVHGEAGAQVVGTVVGGRDAVAEAARLRPDIILVDLTMPDVPGLTLLPQLRRTLFDAILITLSLRDPTEYGEAATVAGADAFVSKTHLERDLLPTIQRLAARQPQRGMTPQEG
jgi:DNA-binding NarL/FixJ family response regulator